MEKEEQLKTEWSDFLKSRCTCRKDRYHQEACSECPKGDDVPDFWFSKLSLALKEREQRVKEVAKLLGETQIELFGGKLPFVFFKGKATEDEKIMIYRQAINDFTRHLLKSDTIINSLTGGEKK